ncbi:MAG TPA: SMC-Scp complex subunit ScpB [Thermoanaerobaculia bacterium]|nr:SMC-Scp complex subunit ScpB [Thermoanaerobaculia bacterium]
MEPTELRAALEAILFVSNEPVKLDELAEAFAGEGREAVIEQLEEIKRALDATLGGFMLEQTAGGWRFATRAEHDPILKKYFAKKGENRLSIAALETLAIVAYRQPITAPEVSEIRGVNSNQTIRTLLERRMIRVAGRKNVVGSPFLYRTTREFLVHFGLNDIRDMPRLEEFGDLIGEQINDDLVLAIETTHIAEGVEVPLEQGEQIDDAVNAELSAGDENLPPQETHAETPAEIHDEAHVDDDAQRATNEVQSEVVNDEHD